jgi:HSP20 family protein
MAALSIKPQLTQVKPTNSWRITISTTGKPPACEEYPMSIPTLWNPLRELTRFEPLGDFDQVLRRLSLPQFSKEYERALDMRLDISEDDHGYSVTIDMPGVRKENIEVVVEGTQVTVSAEVDREVSKEKGKQIYSERFSGRAYRSFSLPMPVDSARVKAHYDGGILKLELPKQHSTQQRRIAVQ